MLAYAHLLMICFVSRSVPHSIISREKILQSEMFLQLVELYLLQPYRQEMVSIPLRHEGALSSFCC
jgi:hypothetical protein